MYLLWCHGRSLIDCWLSAWLTCWLSHCRHRSHRRLYNVSDIVAAHGTAHISLEPCVNTASMEHVIACIQTPGLCSTRHSLLADCTHLILVCNDLNGRGRRHLLLCRCHNDWLLQRLLRGSNRRLPHSIQHRRQLWHQIMHRV
jgi:hypothetical protein